MEMQLVADGFSPGKMDPVFWRDAKGNTLLHYIANKGDPTYLRFFLRKGVDPNAKNQWGETPLHHAAIGATPDKRLDIIKCLFENGSGPYSKDKDKDTFLHTYLLQYDTPSPSEFHSMAEYLIQEDCADLFHLAGGESQVTPLQLAVGFMEPEEDTLELLHSHGVNFNMVNKNGDSLLGVAIYVGRSVEFVTRLITRFRTDPLHLNMNRENILHIAAQSKSLELLEFLLMIVGSKVTSNNKVNINDKDSNSCTPLHVAVHPDNRDSGSVIQKCSLLISAGADVNLMTIKNGTPLHLAILGKNKDVSLKVFQYLVEQGADMKRKHKYVTFLHHFVLQPDTPTPSEFHSMVEYLAAHEHLRFFNIKGGEDEFTPLHATLYNLEPEERTLDLLNPKIVNFQALDNKKDSILAYAIQGGRSTNLLSILINQFKVDWKTINHSKNSLLHIAAQFGSLESLKLILELEGCDVNGEDCTGNTPLHCAMYQDDMKGIVERCQNLIDKGADVTKANKASMTPLDLFRQREYDGDDESALMQILHVGENENEMA